MDKKNELKSSQKIVPFLIGVGGGTASGKSTVCRKIMEKLGQDLVDNNQRRVVCISQESFYKVLNEDERLAAAKGIYDFDHPDALDHILMMATLKEILNNKIVKLPVYDFVTHSRKSNESITVYPADVVLFEGILAFYFEEIRKLFDMKLFVDTDPDTRLSKRVIRDVKDRGRDLELVINQYIKYVKPAFESYCQPTKKYADVIIPKGAENEVAINLIMKYVEIHILRCDSKRPSKIVTNGNSKLLDNNSLIDSSLERIDLKHEKYFETEDLIADDLKNGLIKDQKHTFTDYIKTSLNEKKNCKADPLKDLLSNLCYQVAIVDEKHKNTPNDFIIIK